MLSGCQWGPATTVYACPVCSQLCASAVDLEPPALRDNGTKPAEAVVSHVLASLEKLMPDIRSAVLVAAVDRIVSSATQDPHLEQLGLDIGGVLLLPRQTEGRHGMESMRRLVLWNDI